VTTGPYRYWRHPIYASIIYFTWAGQVEAPAALPIALAALVTIGLFTRMLIEERFLLEAYPAYADCANKAKRLLPFVY
jgi:protein-S-isoprenylcysteine O-methyltransferase Ste14